MLNRYRFARVLFLVAAVAFGHLASGAPKDDAVLLTAEVQFQPPQIRLRWPADSAARNYSIYRKTIADASWGNPLAILGAGASDWVDSNITAGAAYEYQVHE